MEKGEILSPLPPARGPVGSAAQLAPLLALGRLGGPAAGLTRWPSSPLPPPPMRAMRAAVRTAAAASLWAPPVSRPFPQTPLSLPTPPHACLLPPARPRSRSGAALAPRGKPLPLHSPPPLPPLLRPPSLACSAPCSARASPPARRGFAVPGARGSPRPGALSPRPGALGPHPGAAWPAPRLPPPWPRLSPTPRAQPCPARRGRPWRTASPRSRLLLARCARPAPCAVVALCPASSRPRRARSRPGTRGPLPLPLSRRGVAPLRSAASARCGFGSRGRGAPAWRGPLPVARPRRVRDSFVARQRGLARARAHVVRTMLWRGSSCPRCDA
jgi:hypothetical protein